MAKNRLVSIKTVSLPSLEMNAAVFGARLCKLIRKELDLQIWKGILDRFNLSASILNK